MTRLLVLGLLCIQQLGLLGVGGPVSAHVVTIDGGSVTGPTTLSISGGAASFSITTSGTQRELIVHVWLLSSVMGPAVSGITYAGTSMTLVPAGGGSNPIADATSQFIYTYALVSPAIGTNTCTVSFSGTAVNASAAASDYNGCSGTVQNYTSTTQPISATSVPVAITSQTNDMVDTAVISTGLGAITVAGAPNTATLAGTAGLASAIQTAFAYANGASTETVTFTTTSGSYGVCGLDIVHG